MDLTQVLSDITLHHTENPNHGVNCACMDQYIREFRKAITLQQEYVDAYPGDSKELWPLQNRIDYVIQTALRNRRAPRKTSECFCCSCGDRDREGSDPFCRNHGWAGERPCEKHGSPGKVDDDGKMPSSVEERIKEITNG